MNTDSQILHSKILNLTLINWLYIIYKYCKQKKKKKKQNNTDF